MGAEPQYQAFRGSEPPVFANDAERDCAAILDFHGIPWEYEPTTFPLETAPDGTVL